MILTVVAENTNICVGCADEKNQKILFEEIISTDHRKTTAEYTIIFKMLVELHEICVEDIGGGIICSCVPDVTDTIKQAMRQLLHTNILEVGPGIKTGVNIRIDDPAELGVDLLAAAAAGIAEYGAPLIIINLCTLTTISVIDENKHFIGTIFLPGIRLSAETLSAGTANLPSIAIRRSHKLIGSNTVESMQSGVINGCSASIDGLIDRIEREIDAAEIMPVITGEYASLIAAGCRHHMWVDEHLITKGLILIYNKNKRARV